MNIQAKDRSLHRLLIMITNQVHQIKKCHVLLEKSLKKEPVADWAKMSKHIFEFAGVEIHNIDLLRLPKVEFVAHQ